MQAEYNLTFVSTDKPLNKSLNFNRLYQNRGLQFFTTLNQIYKFLSLKMNYCAKMQITFPQNICLSYFI